MCELKIFNLRENLHIWRGFTLLAGKDWADWRDRATAQRQTAAERRGALEESGAELELLEE